MAPAAVGRSHRLQKKSIRQGTRNEQQCTLTLKANTFTSRGEPDVNLCNLRFADHILLIGGSLKRTTTVPDDLTTATTAHGLQFNATSNRGKDKTVAVQGMNIGILPLEGKIKYLGQLIAFNNAVQVELEHRIKCALATFTSQRQELTSPKLFDATVAPSLFHASGTWTMTEETKKKLPDNATTDDEYGRTDKARNRYKLRSCACFERRRHRRRRTPTANL